MTSEPRILPLPDSGAYLVTGVDGRPRVRLRTGRFVLLDTPPTDLDAALAGGIDGAAADYLRRLAVEVRERESADALRRWPTERRAVCLLGSGPLVEDLQRMLTAWGAQITALDADAEIPGDAALVVAYAEEAHGRRRWDELDLLPQRGVAWLRAYREGECLLIDPLAIDGDDPTSVQVAARRRAASSAPASIEAWQRSAPPADVTIDEAAQVLVLARVLHMILVWAQDDADFDRLRTTLWKLVPATGSVSEHTVLPFPAAPPRVSR